MNIKKLTAVVATAFVHFRNPETDARMYATDEQGNVDESRPIGVRVYGPGSKQYRNVQAALATANIKRGKKGLTGNVLQENETELLANTTAEFVNFEYCDADGNKLAEGVDTYRKFYNDVELAHLREQVTEKQGDFGNFTPTASNG